jgi:hypothetical protein
MVVGLQLPIQSVPITIKVVSSNPAQCEAGWWFSPGTPQRVSSPNKTDRRDIFEILLQMAFNTITLTHKTSVKCSFLSLI